MTQKVITLWGEVGVVGVCAVEVRVVGVFAVEVRVVEVRVVEVVALLDRG